MATNTAVPYTPGAMEGWCGAALWQWKNTACPSIHMPRWASRITLEITGVRVERVQDLTHDDAIAEGITRNMYPDYANGIGSPMDCFADLWDSINAKRGHPYSSNPRVWVIKFERVDGVTS